MGFAAFAAADPLGAADPRHARQGGAARSSDRRVGRDRHRPRALVRLPGRDEMTGRFARFVLLLFVAMVAVTSVRAQSNTIRIIFPFAAGGSGDATARLLADKLQTSLGRTVLVESRTGGAGRIGVNA